MVWALPMVALLAGCDGGKDTGRAMALPLFLAKAALLA